MAFREEDYLLLSGIQHFVFCRRQWALIHIEQQWDENLRTIEGQRLHKKAHNGPIFERRGDILIVRSLAVSSARLGIVGACDVVEFHRDNSGVTLAGRRGRYLPVPVEYKRGKPKTNSCDILQLCAQVMCLEEQLVCDIPKGYLYYGQTRHRVEVIFGQALRTEASDVIQEMHELYRRRHTPKIKTGSFCRACSLKNVCLPKLNKTLSTLQYIKRHMEDEE